MLVKEMVNNPNFIFYVRYNIISADDSSKVLFSNFATDEIPENIGNMPIKGVYGTEDGYIEIEV